MGAAAFILAAFLGKPYGEIALAAAIPALLYFLGVFIMVDLQARKVGLQPVNPSILRSWRSLLTDTYLFLPLVLLVYALASGYTTAHSVIFALVGLYFLSWVKRSSWLTPVRLYQALRSAASEAAGIAAATATAGLVVGVVTLTGFGVKATSFLVSFSGGSLPVALIFAMFASLILGMGLPPTAVYILQAAVVVPGLLNMGLSPLLAHLFVFYFSQFSAITPPVALAAFAAAGIANSNFLRTGIAAVWIGFAAYLVPYLFVYRPALLILDYSALIIMFHTFVAICAILALGVGTQGWAVFRTSLFTRLLFLAATITLIDIIGFILFSLAITAHLIYDRMISRNNQPLRSI